MLQHSAGIPCATAAICVLHQDVVGSSGSTTGLLSCRTQDASNWQLHHWEYFNHIIARLA